MNADPPRSFVKFCVAEADNPRVPPIQRIQSFKTIEAAMARRDEMIAQGYGKVLMWKTSVEVLAE